MGPTMYVLRRRCPFLTTYVNNTLCVWLTQGYGNINYFCTLKDLGVIFFTCTYKLEPTAPRGVEYLVAPLLHT